VTGKCPIVGADVTTGPEGRTRRPLVGGHEIHEQHRGTMRQKALNGRRAEPQLSFLEGHDPGPIGQASGASCASEECGVADSRMADAGQLIIAARHAVS